MEIARMGQSICIQCGDEKDAPWKICKTCSFDPRSTSEHLVKSVYLSVGRFDDVEMQLAYKQDLKRFALLIKSGNAVDFDTDELGFVDKG